MSYLYFCYRYNTFKITAVAAYFDLNTKLFKSKVQQLLILYYFTKNKAFGKGLAALDIS